MSDRPRLVTDDTHALDALDPRDDPWADDELRAAMLARADADREALMADADTVDAWWMLDTHGGGPAIGRDVGGDLVWVRSNVH